MVGFFKKIKMRVTRPKVKFPSDAKFFNTELNEEAKDKVKTEVENQAEGACLRRSWHYRDLPHESRRGRAPPYSRMVCPLQDR